VKLITIGKQAKNFFKNSSHKMIKSYTHISESPKFIDARQIAGIALKMHDEELIDEIKLVYTRMISSLSLVATTLTLLPVEVDLENKKDVVNDEMKDLVSYEPSAEEVLDFIIPKYIESVIYGALIESSAAEQSARRIAMENA